MFSKGGLGLRVVFGLYEVGLGLGSFLGGLGDMGLLGRVLRAPLSLDGGGLSDLLQSRA